MNDGDLAKSDMSVEGSDEPMRQLINLLKGLGNGKSKRAQQRNGILFQLR